MYSARRSSPLRIIAQRFLPTGPKSRRARPQIPLLKTATSGRVAPGADPGTTRQPYPDQCDAGPSDVQLVKPAAAQWVCAQPVRFVLRHLSKEKQT